MINGIQLENYRGFEHYQLSGLARVNLLVGKNNSGKTSILEAVHILASQGDPRILEQIAELRGEMIAVDEGEDRRLNYPDVSHFFHGHEFKLHGSFEIVSNPPTRPVKMQIVALNDLRFEQREQFQNSLKINRLLLAESSGRRGTALERDEMTALEEVLALRLADEDDESNSSWLPAYPVSAEGALLEARRYARVEGWNENKATVQSITQESLTPRQMSLMWDQAIVEGREADVVEAMKILEPNLVNIFFLSRESTFRNERGGILVAYEDVNRRRVPLGSLGEGMRRLLALSLALGRARNGILLIDEIDTGLHYSVLGDMWRLIVSTAKRLGIQVFATTHSLDCIRGLAWLCERHPDLAGEVSIQKLDRRLDEAVAFDGSKIRIAVEQDIEVR